MDDPVADLRISDIGDRLCVVGELDASSVAHLEVAIWTKVAGRPDHVSVDLGAVTFADFASMKRMRWIQSAASSQGVTIALEPVSSAVERAVELLDLAAADEQRLRRRARRCRPNTATP